MGGGGGGGGFFLSSFLPSFLSFIHSFVFSLFVIFTLLLFYVCVRARVLVSVRVFQWMLQTFCQFLSLRSTVTFLPSLHRTPTPPPPHPLHPTHPTLHNLSVRFCVHLGQSLLTLNCTLESISGGCLPHVRHAMTSNQIRFSLASDVFYSLLQMA